MKKDIDKLIDNSLSSIKMCLSVFLFFFVLQIIVGFFVTNQIQYALAFLHFIEIVLVTKLVKTEFKYKKKLIAIKNRIK